MILLATLVLLGAEPDTAEPPPRDIDGIMTRVQLRPVPKMHAFASANFETEGDNDD